MEWDSVRQYLCCGYHVVGKNRPLRRPEGWEQPACHDDGRRPATYPTKASIHTYLGILSVSLMGGIYEDDACFPMHAFHARLPSIYFVSSDCFVQLTFTKPHACWPPYKQNGWQERTAGHGWSQRGARLHLGTRIDALNRNQLGPPRPRAHQQQRKRGGPHSRSACIHRHSLLPLPTTVSANSPQNPDKN